MGFLPDINVGRGRGGFQGETPTIVRSMTTTSTECHPHSAPHQRTGGDAGRDCTPRLASQIPSARVIAAFTSLTGAGASAPASFSGVM